MRGGLDGRLGSIHTLLQPHRDPVGHHDSIVHHHPHGDDQSAQGHTLQVDAEHRQQDKRGENSQNQRGPNNDAHAYAHEQRKHHQHDADGLRETDEKVVDRLVDDVRHPMHMVHLDADR